MKNVAVMGAGNVGIYAAKAVLESEDMRLCGFIRRKEDAVEGFVQTEDDPDLRRRLVLGRFKAVADLMAISDSTS